MGLEVKDEITPVGIFLMTLSPLVLYDTDTPSCPFLFSGFIITLKLTQQAPTISLQKQCCHAV